MRFILNRIKASYELDSPNATIPERIKAARRQVIKRLEELGEDDPGQQERSLYDDLDDLFFAVQLFSYPGNYVPQRYLPDGFDAKYYKPTDSGREKTINAYLQKLRELIQKGQV